METFLVRARLQLLGVLLLGVTLIAIGVLTWTKPAQSTSHKLRATGGVEGLNRHQIVKYLQRHSTDIGLEIDIQPTSGSIEATQMLHSREIDLAVVNSLVRSPTAKSVRQVSSITVEAVHLLVKKEYQGQVASDLGQLENLTINVGPTGSETYLLANALLKFCDIDLDGTGEEGQLELDERDLEELLAILDQLDQSPAEASRIRESLPDAIFHSSVLPSPFARRLIRSGDYALIPLPFAEAFGKISVEEEELDRDHVDQVHVVSIEIPQYIYGVSPPTPQGDIATIGCPLILISHEDVEQEALSRLLPWIFDGPIERVYHPPSLDRVAPTYPWHPAATQFRDRNQPLVRADIVQAIQLLISIAAPLIGGCLALYGYYRWRQTLRFMQYFEEFQTLDLRAKGLADDDVVTPTEADEARYLEGQLTRLQQRAVNDFCRNYFHGEGVLENLLSLLSETRDYLRASQRKAALTQQLEEGETSESNEAEKREEGDTSSIEPSDS